MDSPIEDTFDRAVRLATRILGAPVGLLSLVDGERQFFKAQIGLPEPSATDRQTPLTHSFCQHVVAANAPLSVRDAREDPLVKDNLAIPDLGVIAYLGVPVHAPSGHVLGSFCAIQSEPRDWTAQEREALEDIAATIETEIALRKEIERSSKMERAASAAEQRYKAALHAGSVGTYEFDPQSEEVIWNGGLVSDWRTEGVQHHLTLPGSNFVFD
ncbi:MAG: GAF domain-containing protein [Pseudomonadota bacterium]